MSSMGGVFDDPPPEPRGVGSRALVLWVLALAVTAIVLGGVLLLAPSAFGVGGVAGCGGA